MPSVNKVLLSGNLGANPELKVTPKGTPVTELSIATNHRVKEGEAWVDRTDWHRVDVWGKTAELAARYLQKGSAVLIEGALRTDTWVDAETDKKRSKVRIFCERLHFLPRTRDVGTAPAATTIVPIAESETVTPVEVVEEVEIPF
jgi:single-strand DNA-binding protein